MVVGHCCWGLSGPVWVRVVVVVVVVVRVVGCSLVGDGRTGAWRAGVGVGAGMAGGGGGCWGLSPSWSTGSLPPSVDGSSVPCIPLCSFS